MLRRQIREGEVTPTSTLGVGCLLIEDDQVLLVKPNYGKAKDSWILPGGFIDNGEPLFSAALRELKEETGQTGEVIAPLCVRYRLQPSDVYWVLQVKRQKKEALIVQTEELVDVKFISLDNALNSNDVRPMTRYFIASFLANKPMAVLMPEEFVGNNFVYFIK